MSRATRLIETLELARHPEGGWYRETWRGPPGADGRAVGTVILFLLEADQESHWHKVDASEAWLWHEGDPLLLRLSASDAGPVREILLGGELLEGGAMQAVVVPNEWQAARPAGDGDWRLEMTHIHAAADRLLAEGKIALSWKGEALEHRSGPYRIARAGTA